MVPLPPVIAIDGPCGVGKGTVSRLLADRLGFHLLDSGALYRLLALAAKQHSVALDNEEALQVLAGHLDIQFITAVGGCTAQTLLEGQDVTSMIRSEVIGEMASLVAIFPRVRQALLSRQRVFREMPGLVADGRDMGTVVFPDAITKIFLVASREERAKRRCKQLLEQGIDAKIADLVNELSQRDARDELRESSPLKPAPDAIIVDTTNLSIDDVVAEVLIIVQQKMGDLQKA